MKEKIILILDGIDNVEKVIGGLLQVYQKIIMNYANEDKKLNRFINANYTYFKLISNGIEYLKNEGE